MDAPVNVPRRWPRRAAIGAAVLATALSAAWWIGGRETTLQALVARIAAASGGHLKAAGVSGSLYGHMHVAHIEYSAPLRVITADNVDIDWSPWQYFSSGVAIHTLHAADVTVRSLGTAPPAPLPASLAPPFALHVDDARVDRLDFADAKGTTRLEAVQVRLHGDARRWELNAASARTPWGQVTANGTLGAVRPFVLAGSARLTQSAPPSGRAPATLDVKLGGDLAATRVEARGQAGPAAGTAVIGLSPFDAVPLRSFALDAHGIDPGFFNPALPRANVKASLRATVGSQRSVSGSIAVQNEGQPGPLDQGQLPLRALDARLAGTLDLLKVDGMTIDLGRAGRFEGGGTVAPSGGQPAARFTLRTNGLDLQGIQGKLKPTRIAGSVEIASEGAHQTLHADLRDGRLGLTASASVEGGVLRLDAARLGAGRGSIELRGQARLSGADGRDHAFTLKAQASHFDPSALGAYPAADLNATVEASGSMAPALHAKASFAIGASQFAGQALSGRGTFDATAVRLSGVQAELALGANRAHLRGSFGAPADKLAWDVRADDLGALRPGLAGAIAAQGTASGSFAAPRTSFVFDATGAGWRAAPTAVATTAAKNQPQGAGRRTPNQGRIHASGEAWLDARSHAPSLRANGNAEKINPADFGSPLAGSLNARFDAGVRGGADWRLTTDLDLQDSTLSGSPARGHARFDASRGHLGGVDVDLRVGPNLVVAKGGFGTPAERLEWRLDAPQLAALGPDFAGTLRGAGTLSGSAKAPALTGSLDGANLRFYANTVRALRASASAGVRHGPDDDFNADVAVTDFARAGGAPLSASAQASGTRAAHSLRLALRNDQFDLSGEVRGGWRDATWRGSVASLTNKGIHAFTVQAPVPVQAAFDEGAGLAGLSHPLTLAIGTAVIQLPTGSIRVANLDKDGQRWRSSGTAAGVPISWLAQFSDVMRQNLGGNLTLGADWSLDLQTGAAPVLAGNFHVFREQGDLIAGADVPVQLGLSVLDLRAGVAAGALRMQARVEGTRAGSTNVDASVQLLNGRVGNDSPLQLSARADMNSIAWLAPLAGQPGLELDGALRLRLSGSGAIGAPTLTGSMAGERLAVRWTEQGVKLRNGVLQAELAGDQLVLQRLSFDGPQGQARASGNIRFAGGEAALQLTLDADKLELLSRPDRTVVVSGSASLVRDARQFTLNGRLRADRANVELAPLDRPTLSDDIIVLGRTPRDTQIKAPRGLPLTADIEADLGRDFHLKGMGLDAQLEGAVHIRVADRLRPRVTGSIRAVSGTYAAYGQHLTIERGVINFTGAYDNPALNIRAVRKRPEGEQLSETNVEAGVEVRGTALAPAARLVSTPNVSDSDKLAWLVLGHGIDATAGNEYGVLSAAAGALFGGSGGGLQSRLATSLGVDELGLSQAKGLESTVLTIGKRISQRAYLSFEQGAGTATTLVKLRYKLNPRITLQLQTGANTALDVLYSWAFD